MNEAVSSGISPAQVSEVQARSRRLYSSDEVELAIDRMATAITAQLNGKNPLLLCVMNGGLIVSGKLATRLQFPLQLDYLHVSRYRNKTSGAELEWRVRPASSLHERVVLIVDDILDEGVTLQAIVDYCKQQGARQVLSAVLVDKQHQRKLTALKADFVGLETEDYYLYGYGMDYKGYLRNADGIFAVAPEDI